MQPVPETVCSYCKCVIGYRASQEPQAHVLTAREGASNLNRPEANAALPNISPHFTMMSLGQWRKPQGLVEDPCQEASRLYIARG